MTGVVDEEVLLRRLRPEEDCSVSPEGKVRVSTQAFNDSSQRVSVDRECLCPQQEPEKPTWTQRHPDYGVAALVTKDVRDVGPLTGVVQDEKTRKRDEIQHRVDVHPDPIAATEAEPANDAHALITPHPEWVNKSVFKKLKEKLARLAERSIVIRPRNVR